MASDGKWHTRSAEDTLKGLKTRKEGLSSEEAAKRLKEHGHNRLRSAPKPHWLIQFLGEFTSIPVVMLIIAMIILALLTIFTAEKRWADMVVIFIVIFLNATMGYIQENKAEEALESLKKLTTPKVKVLRNGSVVVVDSASVVPGDILSLEEGDKVPADARIIEHVGLEIDEAMLTGENLPVRKDTDIIEDPNADIADRINMIFMGTIVTRGRGCAVVTATGMRTEMGRIASVVQEEKDDTPLQKKVDNLSKQIGGFAIALVIILFIVRMLISPDLVSSFLLSVSLAVAIIPEGLPIVMLVTLAVGMQVMAKRNAIVRKLPAVETLGSTTVICSDKTGTLTRNQMTVKEMWIGGQLIRVTGDGYDLEGQLLLNGKDDQEADTTGLAMVHALRAMVLCNDSHMMDKDDKWSVVGDPTEGALLVLANKAKVKASQLHHELPRCGERVFDPARKMMTTVHEVEHKQIAYIKGAPEALIEMAAAVFDGDKVIPMDPDVKQRLLTINTGFASKAYRVLALGLKELKGDEDIESDDFEMGLTIIGMVGIIDPVREDAKEAIKAAQKAGIKVVMITGDQKDTAKAVAQELGILKHRSRKDKAGEEYAVMTGAEIDEMTDEEFWDVANDINVYARVSPVHKVMIVRALQAKGHIVAMTGDGVNDAPALKHADIGIAMGKGGTDVAREASDMVLTDDNFHSIVNAVEEGRKVYDNIRKFIRYQLSTNMAAILLLFITTLALPEIIPMYPVQLLWVNIMIDGPPALALGLEPRNKDLMRRPPKDPKESILSQRLLRGIAFNGICMGIATVLLFWWGLRNYPNDATHTQTLTFTGFVIFQMINVFNCRSMTRSLFSTKHERNRFLIVAVSICVLLQLAVVYAPPMQFILKTVALGLKDWVLILGLGVTIIMLEESKKGWLRSGGDEMSSTNGHEGTSDN